MLTTIGDKQLKIAPEKI